MGAGGDKGGSVVATLTTRLPPALPPFLFLSFSEGACAMSAYYVYYEELKPGPRTLYFSGPIHSGEHGSPQVGDEIEFRYLDGQSDSPLRAQIRSIEAIDQKQFRFAAQPLGEQVAA